MAALEGQLGQAKQIAEEADKKYEEVSTTMSHILFVEYSAECNKLAGPSIHVFAGILPGKGCV